MEHSDFVVKCYNKQELAQMYFPDLTIRASVNKLRRWMRETARSTAPVVLFIYPYTLFDCQSMGKPYESKH